MTTTPPAPTLTLTVDSDPCPRVEVLVTPMPDDADQVTVWRNWGGQRRVLRDARAVTTSGDFVVIDYEVPFGSPVTYTCQTVDSGGTPSQLSPTSSPVTATVDDVWFQDPLDPSSAMAVALSSGGSDVGPVAQSASFRTVDYTRTSTITPVPGGSAPFGFGDVSQDASSVPFDLRVYDSAAASALVSLLRSAWPLCVRTDTSVPTLPGLAYLTLDQMQVTYRAGDDATLVSASGTSVMPPGAATAVNLRTIDSLGDEASTIDGLGAIYDTIFDLERGVAS